MGYEQSFKHRIACVVVVVVSFLVSMMAMPLGVAAAQPESASPLNDAAITAGYSGTQVQGGSGAEFPWTYIPQLQHDRPLRLVGMVVDLAGLPLHEAHLAVVAEPVYPLTTPIEPQVLGEAMTDVAGRFAFNVPSLPEYQCHKLWLIARRSGYGIGMELLSNGEVHHDVTFTLEPEVSIRGSVKCPDGRPAAGVVLHLRQLTQSNSQVLFHSSLGVIMPPAKRPEAWFPPPVTDDQGEFVLQGVSRSTLSMLHLEFEVSDPRFAPHHPSLIRPNELEQHSSITIRNDGSERITLWMTDPRFIAGTVIAADTRKPIPNAWVGIAVLDHAQTGDAQTFAIWTKADDQGRFQARCRPGKWFTIYVYPPVGLPFPSWVQESKPWPEDMLRHEVTVAVPRGLLVRGRVVEAESGKGVPAAGVEYQLCRDISPYIEKVFARHVYWAAEYRQFFTDREGNFQMAVMPGAAHLLVKAPTPDFVSFFVSHGQLQNGKPGGFFYVVEGLSKIDPKPESGPVDVTIQLRRGKTVRGQVVGPDGNPVDGAEILTPAFPHYDNDFHIGYSAWTRPVIKGAFELRGCDSEKPRRVFFIDVKQQLGATVELVAERDTLNPLTIQMLPCGSAIVRIVDEESHPWQDHPINEFPRVGTDLILLEGMINASYPTQYHRHMCWPMSQLDREHHSDLRTDAEGRVTFRGLIPGAPYRLRIQDDVFIKAEQVDDKEKEFTVQSGQQCDLGTVIVKRP